MSEFLKFQTRLNVFVDNILQNGLFKEKSLQIIQIGALSNIAFTQIKRHNPNLQTKSICLYQNQIGHITRDTKPKAKEPNIDEIKETAKVLNEAKHLYFDLEHNNLIYFYCSLQNDIMVNYIAVNLNYTLKNFKTDNFIVTIGKAPFKSFKTRLHDKDKNGNKKLIKIKNKSQVVRGIEPAI